MTIVRKSLFIVHIIQKQDCLFYVIQYMLLNVLKFIGYLYFRSFRLCGETIRS